LSCIVHLDYQSGRSFLTKEDLAGLSLCLKGLLSERRLIVRGI